MDDKRFDRPVRILTGKARSVSRKVETIEQAARCLLGDWPKEKAGPKHLQARLSCMAALEGLAAPRVAREAFEAAADEAYILVVG